MTDGPDEAQTITIPLPEGAEPDTIPVEVVWSDGSVTIVDAPTAEPLTEADMERLRFR